MYFCRVYYNCTLLGIFAVLQLRVIFSRRLVATTIALAKAGTVLEWLLGYCEVTAPRAAECVSIKARQAPAASGKPYRTSYRMIHGQMVHGTRHRIMAMLRRNIAII
jgi:hypothetical protein